MAIDSNIRKKIKKYIREVQKNQIQIIKAYLYGSYAKGTASPESDIDLAIISPDFSGNRYFDSLKIIPFRRKIDNRIEPVTFKPEDFNESDPLAAEIKNTGIEIKQS
ncbi:MAG: nucleotidyltransferase domain-containing protein [Candidatus Margulisbacteria bacterium]|nr:nucleotidyltransferase domain-containing protein [Candidatus Margulisiibacteriota bacterium]